MWKTIGEKIGSDVNIVIANTPVGSELNQDTAEMEIKSDDVQAKEDKSDVPVMSSVVPECTVRYQLNVIIGQDEGDRDLGKSDHEEGSKYREVCLKAERNGSKYRKDCLEAERDGINVCVERVPLEYNERSKLLMQSRNGCLSLRDLMTEVVKEKHRR